MSAPTQQELRDQEAETDAAIAEAERLEKAAFDTADDMERAAAIIADSLKAMRAHITRLEADLAWAKRSAEKLEKLELQVRLWGLG